MRFMVPLDTWKDRDRNVVLRDLAKRLIVDSFTWDPGEVPASSVLTTTLTSSSYPGVKGLRVGMAVSLTPPSDLDDGLFVAAAYVGSDDSLTVKLRNATASPVNQGSGEWSFIGGLL